jgi:ribonuclease BN (tRNA processing enzyme)
MRRRRLKKLPLSLSSSGGLRLFFLGTGSAFTKKNYQNNLLIIKGDRHVMVDCGTRTSEAFFRLGTNVTAIDTYLITHSHADHVGGLEEAMLMGRYVTKTKPRVVITEEYENILWEQTLRGGSALNERHDGEGLSFGDYWEVLRPTPAEVLGREGYEVTVGGIRLRAFRTRHFPQQADSWKDSFYSLGLVVDDRVLFSGDTQFDPGLVERAVSDYSIETVFHDAQFFTGGIHASLDEVKTLPREIRRMTYLMHYPDNWEDHRKSARSAGLRFARTWHYYDFD